MKRAPLTTEHPDSFDVLLRAAVDASDLTHSTPLALHELPDGTTLGNGRFLVRRLIGRGGMGAVYEALDRESGELVALKVLNRVDPQAIVRFKDEFRILADTVHPHLVGLRDLSMEGGIWFFTMDLVEGPTLSDHLTTVGAVGSAARERELLRLLPELVDGVAAIHATGHLHRDLKPANVLVTRAGKVVIVDFGLVGVFSGSSSGDGPLPVIGTVSHMAPEQARGEPATVASDWYAVGTIAYEALTGQAPIAGDSSEVLLRKRRAEPPRLFEEGGPWPAGLVELCHGLLAPERESRLDYAGILRCLGIDRRAPLAGNEPAFVGRERELGVLDGALDRAERGALVVCRVTGVPGIGKTALVREFLDSAARRRNVIVLNGRCYEREATPFKLLEGIVDSLVESIERRVPRARSAILPLASLFLGVSQFEIEIGAPRITSEPEARSRAVHAFREGLRELGALGTVILHVDDVHWCDVDGVGLLEEVLEAPAPPVLLILTQRDQEESDALSALAGGRFLASAAVVDLLVAGLANDEIAVLAEGLAGRDSALDTAAIARESAGSPYFAAELVRHALEQSRAGIAVESAAPVSVGDAILTRYRSLPSPARRILEALSVCEGPTSMPLLEAATGVHDVARAIALLKSASFVRSRRVRDVPSVEPYHDRVREEIHRALPDSNRQVLHGGFARALEALAPDAWESLLHHYEGAGNAEKAAFCAVRSAERAAQAHAFEQAAHFIRRALLLRSWEPEDERRLHERLGDTLATCGHNDAAAEAYDRAAAGIEGKGRVRLHMLAASQLLCGGNVQSGIERLAESVGYLGVTIPEVSELLPRTAACVQQALEEVKELVFRDEAAVEPSRLLSIDACWWAAAGLNIIHHPAGAFLTSLHLLEAVRACEPTRVARGAYSQAIFSSAPQWDEMALVVRTLMDIGDEASRRAPSALLRFFREYSLAWQAHFAFDVDRTASHVEAAFQHASALGDGAGTAMGQLSQLEMLVLNARLQRPAARARFAIHKRDAQRRGDRIVLAWMRVFDSEWWMTDRPEAFRADSSDLLAELSSVSGADPVLVLSAESMLAWCERYLALHIDALARMQRVLESAREGAWWLLPRVRALLSSEYLASAIAFAEASGRRVRDDAEGLLVEFPPQACGFADMFRAGIANVRGDRAEAIRLLERAQAEPGMDRPLLVDLGARFARGRLLGSSGGHTLVQQVMDRCREGGCENPVQLLESLWPGFRTG